MASIVKKHRKRGDKYYISYRSRNAEGKATQHWLPCADRKDARDLLEEVEQAEREGREYVRPQAYAPPTTTAVPANRMTIEELLERYVDIARQHWSARTLGNARHISRDYIVPYIGNVPVAAVTPMYLQDYYNDLPKHKAVQGNHKRDPGNIIFQNFEAHRGPTCPMAPQPSCAGRKKYGQHALHWPQTGNNPAQFSSGRSARKQAYGQRLPWPKIFP